MQAASSTTQKPYLPGAVTSCPFKNTMLIGAGILLVPTPTFGTFSWYWKKPAVSCPKTSTAPTMHTIFIFEVALSQGLRDTLVFGKPASIAPGLQSSTAHVLEHCCNWRVLGRVDQSEHRKSVVYWSATSNQIPDFLVCHNATLIQGQMPASTIGSKRQIGTARALGFCTSLDLHTAYALRAMASKAHDTARELRHVDHFNTQLPIQVESQDSRGNLCMAAESKSRQEFTVSVITRTRARER